jgi:hypothetical protein
MRTEVIGLKEWLTSIRVPEIHPRCDCGWPSQTVKHVLYYCPLYNRSRLTDRGLISSYAEALSQPETAKNAARWFIKEGIIEYLQTARDIQQERIQEYKPLRTLEDWEE